MIERQGYNISVSYEYLRQRLEEEALKKIPSESAQKAFWEILKQNRALLPLCVVKVEKQLNGGYDVMRGIYEESELRFCFNRPGYLYEVKGTEECPYLGLIDRQLEIAEMESILKLAENTLLNPDYRGRELIPKGFFVFRYMAQWVAGGEEEDAVSKIEVVQGEDLKRATMFFGRSLYSRHENAFWDFEVNKGTGWELVRTKEGALLTIVHNTDNYFLLG